MNIQEKLIMFAKNIAYPYIQQLPFYIEHENNISVLLVGSAATGLCTESSDVDICILCREYIFNEISANTNWNNGKPTEVILNNMQLHFYAISIETIEKKIVEYDDVTFYIYGNTITLNDNANLICKLENLINNDEIKIERKNKAFDLLIRRNKALAQIFEKEPDPISRISVGMEIIEHLLKNVALSDNTMFDKRKRFYYTALTGKNGMLIKPKIDILLAYLSEISLIENNEKSLSYLYIVNECIDLLKSHYEV